MSALTIYQALCESYPTDTRDRMYRHFFDQFSTLLSGDPVLYHARFAPHSPTAAIKDIQSLVTEIITIYFPASYSLEDQKTFEDSLERLIAVFEKNSDGYRASAGGWVEEELIIPGSSEKAKAYVGCIGWRSVEAHM
jgi:hypothetical protein